jgi:hypothetical protein
MPNFVINTASAGDATLGAGQPNRKLGLTSLVLTAFAADTITLKSETPGTSTTSLSGPIALTAGTPFVIPMAPPGSAGQRPQPYVETNPGDSLILTLATGIQTSGFGTYVETPV